MNNSISNNKIEVPSGSELNDKDYINCLLTCLKDMEKNYLIAMSEASNETLYEKLSVNFNQLILLQRETYEVMFRKGWYTLEKVPITKINSKLQTLTQELDNL